MISSNNPFVGNDNFTHRIPLRQNWMPVLNYSTGCNLDLHNRNQRTVITEALAVNRIGLGQVCFGLIVETRLSRKANDGT